MFSVRNRAIASTGEHIIRWHKLSSINCSFWEITSLYLFAVITLIFHYIIRNSAYWKSMIYTALDRSYKIISMTGPSHDPLALKAFKHKGLQCSLIAIFFSLVHIKHHISRHQHAIISVRIIGRSHDH